MSQKKKRKSKYNSKKKSKKLFSKLFSLIIFTILLFSGYYFTDISESSFGTAISNISTSAGDIVSSYTSCIYDTSTTTTTTATVSSTSLDDIPDYSDLPYVILDNNIPDFSDDIDTSVTFEIYSDLDYLDRCQVAFANLGIETMPTEDRESISSVKPSGWQSVTYDIVDGTYLYNRSHLIGFQLSAENANEENLITGTRYFNVDGMLPFENDVADYIETTQNHVLYRVSPIYEGENLVANGVQMEAKSVEDDGEGILFNVFIYNVQPGITINYLDGTSSLD